MADGSRAAVAETVEHLVDEVGSWPGVTVGEHRFGGTEWRVGPREIGHVHARWLVRLSYLYHVNVLKKRPAGAEEYAAVDVAAELDALDPSDAVRAAFERRRPETVVTGE